MTYKDIMKNFQNNPRDIHTVPTTNTPHRWFYTYVEDDIIYVAKAREHKNSSKLSSPRRIEPKQFDEMLEIYHRRCAGECVSQIAGKITACQVYWYGIFAEVEL